jgi:hypothetical protein
VLPLVSYATLRALGASTFWALVAGGLLTAATTVVNTIRRRRLDRLGALVVFEVTLAVVLDFVIRDPRLMLARGSLYLAIGGAWVLVNAFRARPLTVDAAKPFAAKHGRPAIAAYEWAAANSPAFLRIHRALSLAWSAAFIAYAVLRVVIIYSASSVASPCGSTRSPASRPSASVCWPRPGPAADWPGSSRPASPRPTRLRPCRWSGRTPAR